MKLVEHYIMRGTRRLVLIIVGVLIFIYASYSAQRYLTEAANGTLALDVVLDIVFYKVHWRCCYLLVCMCQLA